MNFLLKKNNYLLKIVSNKNFSLILVVLMGLMSRLLVLWFYPDQNFPDAVGYAANGQNFLQTGIINSDLHMPLYIIVTGLAKQYLKIIDIGFSVGSILLIYQLSLCIFQQHKTALCAALVMAFYPHSLFYATSKLTETMYVFLLLASFLALYQSKFFIGSILLVLGILTRPILDIGAPIIVLIFARFIHNLSWHKTLEKLTIYALCYITLMTPWWVHNYIKYHTFVRLNLADGFSFYSGNNIYNQSGGGVSYGLPTDDLNLENFKHIKNPILLNQALKDAAFNFIIDHPYHFVKLLWLKFIRFWRLWPYTPFYQSWQIIFASIISYGPILLGFIGFSILKIKYFYHNRYFDKKLLPLYVTILILNGIHLLTISSIRYRFPIEQFLIVMASHFFCNIHYQWCGQKKSTL